MLISLAGKFDSAERICRWAAHILLHLSVVSDFFALKISKFGSKFKENSLSNKDKRDLSSECNEFDPTNEGNYAQNFL